MTFSRIQHVTSLSSGEAELYGMTAVAAECMYFEGLLTELNFETQRKPVIWSDSTAALAMAGRRGAKKLKHVELRCFVCQDWQRSGRCSFQKVASEDNEADVLTKFLGVETFNRMKQYLEVW